MATRLPNPPVSLDPLVFDYLNQLTQELELLIGELQDTQVLREEFISDAQTITIGGSLTIGYNLRELPKFFYPYIVNTEADLNYSVGDVVPIGVNIVGQDDAISITFDAENFYINFGDTNGIEIADKSTKALSAIDVTKWEFYIKAFT